jgi:hypothetical protein
MKTIYFALLANILFCQTECAASVQPCEKIPRWSVPAVAPELRSYGSRPMTVLTHSTGAVAVTGLTGATALIGAAAVSFASWGRGSADGAMIFAGAMGAATGLTLGMMATKKCGGDRIAIAVGTLAGLAVAVAYPSQPLYALPVAAAVSGTIAGFNY